MVHFKPHKSADELAVCGQLGAWQPGRATSWLRPLCAPPPTISHCRRRPLHPLRRVAYGKVEVFEGGVCEVDLFVQDAELCRVSDP